MKKNLTEEFKGGGKCVVGGIFRKEREKMKPVLSFDF